MALGSAALALVPKRSSMGHRRQAQSYGGHRGADATLAPSSNPCSVPHPIKTSLTWAAVQGEESLG